MKICIVLGTRPEIIKLYSTIKYCEKHKLDYFVIHTGQHYIFRMDGLFFKQLGLPTPKYNLEVGSGSHGVQTARMLERVETILIKEKPDIVLVQGDTNTTLVGALCAVKLWIKVGHIEAGLRSYDRKMPEEINRIIVDHISDYLFCPTKNAERIVLGEGINKKNIIVTGSTLVDVVNHCLKLSEKNGIMDKLGLEKNKFILLTAHRPRNVDTRNSLRSLLGGVDSVSRKLKIPVVFPIHPRTKKNVDGFNIAIQKNIKLIEPVGFFEFLQLEMNAGLVLTDSGGIQEEACILRTPCITLRSNTERPETLDVGSNMLTGINPKRILKCSLIMFNKDRNWRNPFGGGRAAEISIRFLGGKL